MMLHEDFVFVDELVSGIRWDAKYATWDNFTGKPVEGYLANRIVGSYERLCAALEGAREKAASLGFGLLLWDGYRPQRAVDCFLRWSRQPDDGRLKLRHYPNIDRPDLFEKGYVAAKSGHTRGSTVDLTLYCVVTGELVPMGGDHDLMDPLSHHGADGISRIQATNRQQLRSIMEDCGFELIRVRVVALHIEARAVPRHLFRFSHRVVADIGLSPGTMGRYSTPRSGSRWLPCWSGSSVLALFDVRQLASWVALLSCLGPDNFVFGLARRVVVLEEGAFRVICNTWSQWS